MQAVTRRLLFATIALLTVAGFVHAQESRGSITGIVTDSTGAIVPGAKVTVLNVGTNTATVLTANSAGQYTALYLVPGTYNVTVEQPGFRKTVNESIIVNIGSKLTLDFHLQPGGVSEAVDVVVERPLLDQASATTSQLIDSKLINEIPMGDGTAYSLTRLVPGASFEKSYALARPMDNDNLRGMSVSGTINSEFTIDGSSNVASGARAAIQPPADAIQEMRIDTAAYDAQVGHTGAGSVNLALKSGTNQLHGAISFFNRDASRSANQFSTNATPGAGKTPREYNRLSAMLSGPIIPNKTFFMVSYEKLNDNTTESVTGAVPTEKMRRGDFSELLPLGTQIYNPFLGTSSGGVITRPKFDGNIIPTNLLNPVALNVLKYYPLPNRDSADFTSNYRTEQPWKYSYHFEMAKIDHVWGPSHRTYLRFLYNFRREERYNWAGTQQGVDISRGGTDRYNYNVAVGHTAILTPTVILDVKASWLRFSDNQQPAAGTDIDPMSLGFAPDMAPLFRGYKHIPMFNIDGSQAVCGALPSSANPVLCLGGNQSGFNTGRQSPFYNIQIAPTLTKTWGSHTLKLGYDWRSLRYNEVNEGMKGGAFYFDSTYTKQTGSAPGRYGQGLAAFLLGLPNNASYIETRADFAYETVSHGFFIHDDWRVSNKLTLNIGVRYDLELGMTESQNRNVRGFDTTTVSPIAAQAQTAYAANYAAKPGDFPLTPAQFQVLGGYQYLSDENPNVWNADKNNIQPRLGFTYKLDSKTLVRGGAGLFVAPFQIPGSGSSFGVSGIANTLNQYGYTRNTNVPTSTNGIDFVANLTRPIPSGVLALPVGSSQGLSTNLGGNPGTIPPVDRKNPQFWRMTFGFQRELPGQFVVDISYLGQRGTIPYTNPLNYTPEAYRSTSPLRDDAAERFLTNTVANPFRGLTPDNAGSNGATIARRRLLQAFPQFDTLTSEFYDGSNTYNGVYVRLEKRFTKGFMLSTSYTYSHITEKIAPLNAWQDLEERLATVDRPHRLTFATVAELPWGKGRRWGNNWSSVLDSILGGWQFTGRYEWQTGQPLTWGNVYYDPGCGNPKDLKSRWGHDANGKKLGVDVPMIDTSCFYTFNGGSTYNGQPLTYQSQAISLSGNSNIRTFPTVLPNVRFMNHHIMDIGITKTFKVGNRVKLQLKIEALNAENYTIFNSGNVLLTAYNNANFGRIVNLDSSTTIRPRDFQLGARLTF